MDEATILEDARRPGIELLHLQGPPGYQDEQLLLENGLSNGLRIQIVNDDMDAWAAFHIKSPATAKLIAGRLLEYCERIHNPAT